MIPLATPDVQGNEESYLRECIQSTFVSSVGPFVDRFEQMVAGLASSPRAVSTSSGTCALHLALHVAGVRPDDLVIVPTLTFIASANAVAHCHADPWLFDIDPKTWNLDPAKVAIGLDERTRRIDGDLIHVATGRRVAAIMPVHGLGLPADTERLGEIAHRYRLPLIADGAAALGATRDERPIGELCDLTVFSFNGNKTVTAGGGGAIVGRNDTLLDRAAHLASTARVGGAYDHDAIGFNYRMTNLTAAVGCAQLERLESFLVAKRTIRAAYDDLARRLDLGGFPDDANARGACWFSGLLLDEGQDATAWCEGLAALGVGARPFWKPVHLQAPYADAPCDRTPVADQIWKRIVTLPCSTWMSGADLATVCDAVQRVHESSAVAGGNA
ncbi:MAG: pyridoxal-5'-phosphate-dependent protein [Planctomycetes bacterium]|nr:pyridoxal-5'-phosphate-dependent protein [Planctomycetota bacterium]